MCITREEKASVVVEEAGRVNGVVLCGGETV